MRFTLFVLLILFSKSYAQSAFSPIPAPVLSTYLPHRVDHLERWSAERIPPYVRPDAAANEPFFPTTPQMIQRPLSTAGQTRCEITAAGVLLTADRFHNRASGEWLTVEITDYTACLSRIQESIHHFSQYHIRSGDDESHQFFLNPGTKVRISGSQKPGGEWKGVFIIRDRIQVYMKYGTKGFPPDYWFLVDVFRYSSLSDLIESFLAEPHLREPMPITPGDPLPDELGEFRAISAATAIRAYPEAQVRRYQNDSGNLMHCYAYSNRQQVLWSRLMAEVRMTAPEYLHKGHLVPFQGIANDISGHIRWPRQCQDAIELTALIHDDMILRILAEGCHDPKALIQDMAEWKN